MKMVLHYLRFDWKRWRVLLLALWGLLAVYVLLAWRMQQELAPGSAVSRLQNVLQGCGILIALCAAMLCVNAGGADSPVNGMTWLMTRPRRAPMLISARLLFIIAGVVLPIAGWHALILNVMQFNASTVTDGWRESVLFLAAATATLMLWALVRPCFSGLVLGIAAAAFLSTLFIIRALRPPEEWFKPDPSPLLTALALALPALAGIRGVWQRQDSRKWAWSGFRTGFLCVAIGALLPVAEYAKRHIFAGELEGRVFTKKSMDWEMAMTAPGPGKPIRTFMGEAIWNVPLRIPKLPDGIEAIRATVEAIALRDGPESAWSDWITARGDIFLTDRKRDWLLEFACDPDKLTNVQNGELRVKTRLRLRRSETQRLPLNAGAFLSGDGWTFHVLSVDEDDRGGFSFGTLVRSAGIRDLTPEAVPDWNTGEDALFSQNPGTPSRSRIPGLTTVFGVQQYRPKEKTVSPRPLPEFLRLTNTSPVESFYKTLHLTGVTLTVPVKAPRDLRTVPEKPRLQRPGLPPGLMGEPPRVWLGDKRPKVPWESASGTEVATFLSILADGHPTHGLSILDGKAEHQTRLAAHVPAFLPMFIEAFARQRTADDIIAAALIAGTPEERREEVLPRIPEVPALAKVAIARGWEAQAKPFVLQLVQREGAIPGELEALCRSYRDPVFHPFMRQWFTADVPTVRYWESMPDLAPDLPSQLAKAREWLLRLSHPGAGMSGKAAALLYSGDPVGLELVLRWLRNNPSREGWPGWLLRRWVRTSDESPLPADEKELEAWIGNSTSTDYTFHPVRRYFVRKPAPPKP